VLYPNNEFYKNSKVDEGVAYTALSVEVPQSGLPPRVFKNPQSLPVPSRLNKDDKSVLGG
jgi:hypothetical protein